ncbi:unannotated protein [freshwater metagenome]|uniref:Unannotated protein n=1 Tax=freshwater metagenome TaxID=449393 RepID=A0A6J6C521_9ZZZZ
MHGARRASGETFDVVVERSRVPRSTPSPSSSPSSSRSSSPSPSASRGDEDPGSSSSKPGPLHLHSPLDWLKVIGRNSRRLAVFVVGVAILGAGAAMVVLPGPGVLVMLVGLAVLATEFAWAERALDRTAGAAATAASKVSGSRSGRLALVASGLGMVVGGAVVVALVGQYRIIGASVAVAGVIGLATLTPPVQRWLESRTDLGASRRAGAGEATDTTATDTTTTDTHSADTHSADTHSAEPAPTVQNGAPS